MCGLAAIFLKPRQRSAAERESLAAHFVANLLANENRGKDATGAALIRRDGSLQIYKAPLPASHFVETPGFTRLLAALDDDTVALLGHTRFPTKGSPNNNHNNHPLQATYTIGVHNGHITNDDTLFTRHRLPRVAEVDSEVIFRLLDGLDPTQSDRPYLEAVARTTAQMRGPLAVLGLDLRRPERLIVIKADAPLSLHYDSEREALFFSSRYLFLRNTFGPGVTAEVLKSSRTFLFDAHTLPTKVSAKIPIH